MARRRNGQSSISGSMTGSSPPPPLPSKRTGNEKRQKTKPPRYRPLPRALNEIRKLQTSYGTCIPLASFRKMVRDITVSVCDNDLRYEGSALCALLEASEHFAVGVLEDAYLITLHCKRVTLKVKDMQLAYRIRGDYGRYSVQ